MWVEEKSNILLKIINLIDYIKESTPLEVKNHIINSFKENDTSKHIPIKNPSELIQTKKQKKRR